MIVTFENNVICPDENVRDYLLACHVGLKEVQDGIDTLCLIRLHKEEGVEGAEQVDLM